MHELQPDPSWTPSWSPAGSVTRSNGFSRFQTPLARMKKQLKREIGTEIPFSFFSFGSSPLPAAPWFRLPGSHLSLSLSLSLSLPPSLAQRFSISRLNISFAANSLGLLGREIAHSSSLSSYLWFFSPPARRWQILRDLIISIDRKIVSTFSPMMKKKKNPTLMAPISSHFPPQSSYALLQTPPHQTKNNNPMFDEIPQRTEQDSMAQTTTRNLNPLRCLTLACKTHGVGPLFPCMWFKSTVSTAGVVIGVLRDLITIAGLELWLNNCIRNKNYTTFILQMFFVLLMLLVEGVTAISIFIPCFANGKGIEKELEQKLNIPFPRGVLAAISWHDHIYLAAEKAREGIAK